MVARALERPVLDAIDWSAPWFAAVAEAGRALARAADARGALNSAAARLGLRNEAGRPLQFIDAAAAGRAAYEAHVHATGGVPTRDNVHDLFNGLVWLALPHTKARLNTLQAEAIGAAGVNATRGALRDAATLLDENGVLLVTERDDLVEALRRHDWRALFVGERAAWHADVRVVVVGHALMDKLRRPYKGITAHALPVRLPPAAALSPIDAGAAAALDPTLTTRRLLPLPVLGIPGWADNGAAAYYDDASVFRPRRDTRADAAHAGG
jgi:hypothetical protein